MKKYICLLLLLLVLIIKSHAQKTFSPRPNYHYTPPKNWANDPNGLVYLDCEYHLFYQYNPFGTKWGHMSWAHAVSRDLKSWKTLPLALPEYKNADGTETMIFSGCTIVDSLNTSGFFQKGFKKGLVAVYTSNVHKNNEGITQHQSLAYSSDKGRTWKYYDKNPVLDIGLKDFRDPNVIWYPERKVWIMTVVKSLEYTVQFYESRDLKKWNLLSEFGKKGDVTRVWECPSLIKVPVENSQQSKWILMLSSGHRQNNYLAMQYFVGEFDGKNFISQPQSEILYVDEGKDFYAAIPFFNLPKTEKNPIIIGWNNDWEYATDIPVGEYRSGFSVPRKISVYQDGDIYKLKQTPIVNQTIATETKSLKSGEKYISHIGEKTKNSYRLKLDIDVSSKAGMTLELIKGLNASAVLKFDTQTSMLSFDRTKSGQIDFNKRFSSVESIKVSLVNGHLSLDLLVDKNILEIYANNGKQVMSDLVFPNENQYGIELKWF